MSTPYDDAPRRTRAGRPYRIHRRRRRTVRHSTLALSLSPILIAFIVAIVTALLVERAGAPSDTSLAIVLTGGFAVGSIVRTVSSWPPGN